MSPRYDYVFSGNIYDDMALQVIEHTSLVKPQLSRLADQTDQLFISLRGLLPVCKLAEAHAVQWRKT